MLEWVLTRSYWVLVKVINSGMAVWTSSHFLLKAPKRQASQIVASYNKSQIQLVLKIDTFSYTYTAGWPVFINVEGAKATDILHAHMLKILTSARQHLDQATLSQKHPTHMSLWHWKLWQWSSSCMLQSQAFEVLQWQATRKPSHQHYYNASIQPHQHIFRAFWKGIRDHSYKLWNCFWEMEDITEKNDTRNGSESFWKKTC